MQAFLGKAGASRSEHGCPAISAGTSGKLTWKAFFAKHCYFQIFLIEFCSDFDEILSELRRYLENVEIS